MTTEARLLALEVVLAAVLCQVTKGIHGTVSTLQRKRLCGAGHGITLRHHTPHSCSASCDAELLRARLNAPALHTMLC